MGRTSDFFDKLKDHTEIKLRILAKFVVPWARKLGYKVRYRSGTRIWYVDGFAGPGKYGDGSPGSPLIGAGEALTLLRERRGYVLGCVNVELRASRFKSLEHVTAHFREEGVPIHNLQGDFSQSIPQIMGIVGSDDPILVFIDPFGVSPLKYEALRPLTSRRGEVDLILVFQSRAVARLYGTHPDYMTEAVGGDDWLAEWGTLGVEAVYRTLARNLRRDARFLEVVSYGVRGRRGAAAKYYMLMASRSYHAFELLNDSVSQEEVALDRKAYAQAAQSSFLPQLDSQEEQKRLVDVILAYGRSNRTTTRQQIVRHIVLSHWAEWHTSEVKNAVSGLVDAGRIKREKRGHIDTDPLTFVSPG
jgi:three-Cys-motif partner protein